MSATPTRNPLSKNAVFAAVLLRMVKERCEAQRATSTLRTGLQAAVQVQERPYVRRGLDALLDLGLLAASGENIAATPKGLMLLALAAPGARPPAEQADVAARLLAAIDEEERLLPSTSIDDLHTLQDRLDGYRERRRTRVGVWQVVLGLLAIGVLWMAWRILG